MDFAIDKPGELRFIRNSSNFGKMSTAARRANEKPEPDGLWFTLSSGEWIRTTDLRVMREKPDFGTFDLQTPQFSESLVLRFRQPTQTPVDVQRAYSNHFSQNSQAVFSITTPYFLTQIEKRLEQSIEDQQNRIPIMLFCFSP